MLKASAPQLLCFSHLRWNFVFQRPQHLLTRASKIYGIHYFEEPHFTDCTKPHLELTKVGVNLRVLTPHLPTGCTQADAIGHQRSLIDAYVSRFEESPAVGWYYTPMALEFTAHLSFPVTVYDCMDELANFKGAPSGIAALEHELFRRADLVFTGGRSLFEAKRHHHDAVYAFPSSIDADHFRPARGITLAPPDDLMRLATPRIAWFGVIDERLDIDLLAAVADARPDWQFVMIGPVVKVDESSLPRRANIHWLGSKTYADLPRYLAHVDVGWMPFAINASTRFISPTKTPEFLAAGLPVVSTPIRDVERTWGAVRLADIARTPAETINAIENRLASGRNAEWLRRIDRQLALTSWDQTWTAMQRLIAQTRGSRTSRKRIANPIKGQVARV